jgi:hypothetical protein
MDVLRTWFGVANLQQMRNFCLAWPPGQIYQTVSVKLRQNNAIIETPADFNPHGNAADASLTLAALA